MVLERLNLTPVVLTGADEELNKAPRLPRWTRQELLVLIQGKRLAENRVRRGARTSSSSSSAMVQVEPKWSSVSSYCKRHGVNRGPVQCRKRWSNLAGDFKKIKEWESQIKEEAESFWVMRNDLRRERKLPGFFDKEVYEILDGGGPASLALTLAPSAAEIDENEVVFDSGRKDDDGVLFSSDEVMVVSPQKDKDNEAAPTPISAATERVSPPAQAAAGDVDVDKETRERKRKRDDEEEREREPEAEPEASSSLQKLLIEAMERNGRMLSSQLEIQNANAQLDREQRKDEANSLFSVLNKIADAMVRIADKL